MFERLFHVRERGSTLTREVRGGIVTFLTLSYIIFVQPAIMKQAIHKPPPPQAGPNQPTSPEALQQAEAEMAKAQEKYQADLAVYREDVRKFEEGVFVATCLASAFACLLMGFLANYPFALAPAMGHNVFFAVTVCGTIGVGAFRLTWQEALAANFISGAVFLLLSFTGLRKAVMHAIPDGLKYAIAVGIGFLIAFVGLQYGGLVVDKPGVLVGRGSLTEPAALLTLFGLALTAVLLVRRTRGALLIGILATGAVGLLVTYGYQSLAANFSWPTSQYHLVPLPERFELPSLTTVTMFKLDFAGLFWNHGFVDLLIIMFIFLFLDLFDTVGTLMGVAERGGMLVDGKLPRAGRALASDAAGTVVGTCLGTSTVTSYIESASGIAEGARTGLANVVTAALLLASLLARPIVSMFGAAVGPGPVPSFHPVLAPVLIIVGSLMMTSVAKIRWDDYAEAIPAFLCMVIMLFSLSIADGIAWGFIAYALLKVAGGKGRDVGAVVYVVSLLAILRYVLRPM